MVNKVLRHYNREYYTSLSQPPMRLTNTVSQSLQVFMVFRLN